MGSIDFKEGLTKAELEEGHVFAPRFGADGLVTCIATHAGTGELLMVAHMNREALARTIETGEAWYWSRSRGELWHKGATSGQIQTIEEMRSIATKTRSGSRYVWAAMAAPATPAGIPAFIGNWSSGRERGRHVLNRHPDRRSLVARIPFISSSQLGRHHAGAIGWKRDAPRRTCEIGVPAGRIWW